MNKVIQLSERTYYLSGPFQVGIYVMSEPFTNENFVGRKPVCLIESGFDDKVAGIVDGFLEENNFYVYMIINTHYHADHCGGNYYFKEKYDAILTSSKINAALMSNFDICPSIIWGAAPIDEIMNKLFYIPSCETVDIANVDLPEGISYYELPGHCISMILVKTADDVMFIGDAVVGNNTLKHHSLTYIYDIGIYLESLDKLEKMDASIYVPYHTKPTDDIRGLVALNKKSVLNNIDTLLLICDKPKSTETIIAEYFDMAEMNHTVDKYAIEASLIKTYLSYLHNIGELDVVSEDNYLKWFRGTKTND